MVPCIHVVTGGTWTAAGLIERQPLMFRLVRWRSLRAHAAMDASVSLRQQCRPRAVSLVQCSATAMTPISRTFIIQKQRSDRLIKGAEV